MKPDAKRLAMMDQHNDQLLADARDRFTGLRYERIMRTLERMGDHSRDEIQDVVLVAYLGMAFICTAQERAAE